MEDALYESYVRRLQLQTTDLNVCRFCVLKKRKITAISALQPGLDQLFHRVTQLQLDTSTDYPDLICEECESALKETADNISAFLQVENFWRTFVAKLKSENDNFDIEGCSNDDSIFEHQIGENASFVLKSELGDIQIEVANDETQETLTKDLKYLKCHICDEMFGEELDLKHHMNVCHQINMCIECGKEFPNRRRLSSHMRNHRNNIKAVNGLLMTCDICKSTFHSKVQLSAHMRIHIKKSYICDICGQELRSLISINRHILTHRHEHSGTTDDRRRTGNKLRGHLPCSLCSNAYSRSATLREHLKKKHPFDGPAKWEEIASLMCIKCDEIFPSDNALKEHREMHNRFQCSVCKQNMTCMESLVYHMSTHSKKDRPHSCQLCGCAFIQKSHLTQHIRCVHSLERPHSCQQCKSSFAEKHELAKHVRAVHLQERRFGCDQCERKFKKRSELKIHQQSHTGIYRYKCEICNKNFGNSTKFTEHNANKHPNNMFA